MLNRCIKMYDTVAEIYKLVNFIDERFQKMLELKQLLKKDIYDGKKLKTLYKELVRLSQRVLSSIRLIKSTEKCLNRPFMFNRQAYDDDFMFHELRRKRLQILSVCPQLNDSHEMMMFMKQDGEVCDVRRLNREDFSLDKSEHLWHSDKGDMLSQIDDAPTADDFTELNRRDNDSPMEKTSVA